MFGFRKKEHKEAANRIGVEIHRQLFEALKVNETVASEGVSSPFITGYLYGFIYLSFTQQGYEGYKLVGKYIKYICNGVLPGELYDIFEKQLTALEIAKELGKGDVIKLFEKGCDVGVYDSHMFDVFVFDEANNMFKYLTGQELEYEPMPH